MDDQIRVMVVDDSASTRDMLREALSFDDGIAVVGEAGSGQEAVARAGLIDPDVILMDVRMPDGDGAKAARAILAGNPATRIVALTWSDDPAHVRDMLTAGAIGYVVKGGSIDELVGAIRRASVGEPELDQRVLPAAMGDLRRLLDQERGRREQIERLARAREEFVQVLSHELRTPLTVIVGALKMLHAADVSAEEASLVQSAIRRASELEFLVEGLELIAAAPEQDTAALPAAAIRAAFERLGQTPGPLALEDGVWVGVPQHYLERVAYELISNAAGHGQPPIEVSFHGAGTGGVLVVADGGGWAPEGGDFDAFVQGDMSATRTRGGFGMGLFVASRLCQACDGCLKIRAEDGRTVVEARFRMPC
jgi:DNA-binding NarL/FixJ family response regulator